MASIVCTLCLADITDVHNQAEITGEHGEPMLVCLKCAEKDKESAK